MRNFKFIVIINYSIFHVEIRAAYYSAALQEALQLFPEAEIFTNIKYV